MSSLVLKNTANASIANPGPGKTSLFVDSTGKLTLKDDLGNTNIYTTGNVGSNTQVLFNDSGNIAGNSNFTFAKTTGNANVGNIGATNGVFTNISGALTTASQPNITSVGTLTSLAVTGNITSGNLIGSYANGNSNVNIPAANGNVNISAVGNANVLVVTGTGVNVAGTLNATGNLTGGNLTLTNLLNVATYTSNGTSHSRISALGNNLLLVSPTGKQASQASDLYSQLYWTSNIANVEPYTGNDDYVWAYVWSNGFTIDGSGSSNSAIWYKSNGTFSANSFYANLNITTGGGNITGANVISANTFIGVFANGNSNVNIPAANGNVNISAVGNANVLVVTGTGVNVAGTLNATGNLTGGNLIGTLANGNANVRVFANANIAISTQGVANVLLVTNNGITVSNLSLSNPGIGNTTSISFLKSSDTTGFQVAEYVNDKTLYNFYINDNAWSTGGDGFMWTLGSYTSVNHLAQPIYIDGGYTTRLTAANTQFYGNIFQNTAKTFSTSNVGGTGLASSIQIFGDPTKLTQSVTGTITITALDVSGFTGNSGQQFWISLTGTGDTFQWGLGWGPPGNPSPTPIQTGLSVSTSPVTLSNGVKVTFSATTGGVAGDAWSCILWTSVNNTLGPTTISGNLAVTGNAVITGNLTIDGNLSYLNIETLAIEDPIINLQTGPNNAAPTSNSGKDVGLALNYYDSAARIAFIGWDVSNAEFGMASQASIASEIVTFTSYGNLRIGNVIGTIAAGSNTITTTGNITGGNLIGSHANGNSNVNIPAANGNVNISAVGNANIVVVTGTGANITGTLNVTGNSTLSNLNVANYTMFSVENPITAAGTVQSNATSLTKQINVVSTVTSGTGVKLPTAIAGMRITIMNTSSNNLLVYPEINGIINAQAANTAFTLVSAGKLDFVSVSTTQWYTLSATFA